MNTRNDSGVDIRTGITDLCVRECGRDKNRCTKSNETIASDYGAGFEYSRGEERITNQMSPSIESGLYTYQSVTTILWVRDMKVADQAALSSQ